MGDSDARVEGDQLFYDGIGSLSACAYTEEAYPCVVDEQGTELPFLRFLVGYGPDAVDFHRILLCLPGKHHACLLVQCTIFRLANQPEEQAVEYQIQ